MNASTSMASMTTAIVPPEGAVVSAGPPAQDPLDHLDAPFDSSTPSSAEPRRVRLSIQVVTVVLLVATCIIFYQLIPWLVLAAWFATLVRPALKKLARGLGGRGAGPIGGAVPHGLTRARRRERSAGRALGCDVRAAPRAA